MSHTRHNRRPPSTIPGRWLMGLLLATSLFTQAQAASPDTLRAHFAELRDKGTGQLAGQSIYLRSSESAERMQGEVHALIDQPFDRLRQELAKADRWCDVLILHINVKYCRAVGDAGAPRLQMRIGRKHDQPLASAYAAETLFSPGRLLSRRQS